MRRRGCRDYDVVVAATGDDKVNLVVSLLAKTEFGVRRVVARVNHPKNEWLYNQSWGVDVAVSTPRMLTALVEEAVSVGDLVRLMSFMQGEASLVEVTLADDSPLAGQRIDEIALPPDTALVAILREGRVVLPVPEATLEGGDEILAVATTPQVELELAAVLGSGPMVIDTAVGEGPRLRRDPLTEPAPTHREAARSAGPVAAAGVIVNLAVAATTLAIARLLNSHEYGTFVQLVAVFYVLTMPGLALGIAVVRRVSDLLAPR